MARMVIVVDFEEPADDMVMGGIIHRIQEAARVIEDAKLHMARKDVANRIITIFTPLHVGEENSGPEPGTGS